jgi:homocitrate synthase NifV
VKKNKKMSCKALKRPVMTHSFHGIIDSTLREGEQTPGVCFSQAQRKAIIRQLCQVGVEEIELGIASDKNSHLPELFDFARQASKGNQRLGLWCRCRSEDIAFAASCRPDVLSLSIPASDLHITERLRKNHAWVLTTLCRAVAEAGKYGIPCISLGLEDATRANHKFLCQLATTAADCGVQRLRIADTVGIGTPAAITKIVQMILQISGLSCGVHTHNDFGMATANAIAALEAGASWIDATVLGLGERAGNCRLEETVAFLCLQRGFKHYRTGHLPALCQTVSQAANTPIARNHPVVGEAIFTCETGLHLHGLTVNPRTYEPYSPEKVGACRTMRFGHKSGKRALSNYLQALGYPIDDNRADTLVRQLKKLTDLPAQGLSDSEILHLATP